MQGELRLIGEINSQRVDVPWDEVALCNTVQQAYWLCMKHSRVKRTQDNWADLLGFKSRGALNNVLNSDQTKCVRHLGRIREIQLQQLACNNAIEQWADLYQKGMLNCQKTLDDEEQAVLQRLAEIRARKSA